MKYNIKKFDKNFLKQFLKSNKRREKKKPHSDCCIVKNCWKKCGNRNVITWKQLFFRL